MVDVPPKPWPTGTSEQLEPLVRRVLAPNPSPYTYTGTQTYLVGAGKDLAVIDPGPDEEAHLAALVDAIGERNVVAIMCTHTHRDHSPASIPLKARTGAPIIGCAPLALDSDGPRADAPFDASYVPDRVLTDGERVSGDGWTLTALATPGHTSNHLCFALEESDALFTGDHVMGWSTSVVVPPDGDMRDYMQSLDTLYRREDRIYYPAHGPAVERPRQLVRGMIGHRRQRERQILKLLDREPHEIADMVPQMYKGLDPRLVGAAGKSVEAHLIDLERRGEVARSDDVWRTM
ncbi:MAG: MBL fold metallo-hydrolase [Sphingomonadales bacterium CG12_big_fil_rev_8_21_14_0_65_65_10]|nr:MAG: MBL fold metallo-hydrolase [Sphingomonadales bacterium CG12_big_fil_rev_8_21_14_0_65_65_10]